MVFKIAADGMELLAVEEWTVGESGTRRRTQTGKAMEGLIQEGSWVSGLRGAQNR